MNILIAGGSGLLGSALKKEFSKEGHEVVILSSKPWWSIHDTLMWLGENKIPSREIHFIEEKWKVECDAYIDDAPHQIENYVRQVPDKLILRFCKMKKI